MTVPGQITAPERLRCERVGIDSGGITIDAYVARPEQRGSYPGLIIIHEAFGPVEHIADVTRRFAHQGYVALAPNLYSRIGAPDVDDLDSVVGKMYALADAQVVSDLEAAATFLRDDGEGNGSVGCVGFCSGGRQALLLAASSETVDAAIDCWGGHIARATVDQERTACRPTPPIELVAELRCPLLAVFGADDTNPSLADAAALRQGAAASESELEVLIFPDAGHAFFADYRPTYVEAAAHALWPRMLDFLAAHLQGRE